MNFSTEIFRAYDIRGKYPFEVNEEAFLKIGIALGKYFAKKGKKKIFVGQDVRFSSSRLKESFVDGLNRGSSGKLDIIDMGFSTTPMLNFCASKYRSPAAIITASHDPKNYNGLKIVDQKGGVLSGEDILRIMKNNI